jgi:YesN/AraC family two-component response regulator
MQAPDAAAAMDLIEGPEPIHLLLTDIVMPGEMDGRELACVAGRRRPLMRVLLTSGFPDGRSPRVGSHASASRLLSKPYRKEDLLRSVRAAIDDPGTESPSQ